MIEIFLESELSPIVELESKICLEASIISRLVRELTLKSSVELEEEDEQY